MTNIIERLQSIIAAGTIFLTVIAICNGCVNFLNNQNFDEFLESPEVYNFTDNTYLVKDSIVLCGVEYKPGDVIQKDVYNKCSNK